MKEGAKYWLGSLGGRAVLNTLLATARFRVNGPQPHLDLIKSGQPVVYTLWHGRLLPLTYFHRNQSVTTLISQSRDGEYIARIVESWGYTIVCGSSSRGGGAALRELVKAVRSGSSLAITPDGPRGPRQKLKRGVLTAAQLSGSPLIPAAAAATAPWWFEGWDRFLVPRPFSKIYLRYADPIYVPREADEAQLQELEARVERVLNELTATADSDAQRN